MFSRGVGQILVIVGNNLRRLVRSPIMLFTTVLLPFMVIAVVGIALGGNQSRLNTGVLAYSTDTLEHSLVSAMEGSGALHVVTFHTAASLDRALRLGQVDAGIVLPAGYGRALEAAQHPVVKFVTTPNEARAASVRTVFLSLLDNQTGAIQAAEFAAQQTGRPLASEFAMAHSLMGKAVAPAVGTQVVAGTNSLALGFSYTAPSNLVLFTIITSLTSAAALIDTRSRGIVNRMFSMPVSRLTVLLGELAARFVVAVCQALLILLVSSLAFGVAWGDPLGVAAVTLALCAFGGALGMAVGFAGRSVTQAVSFGPPAGVVLGMLGGCMWPLNIVAGPLQTVGHISPDAWAMDGFVKLINDNAGLSSVLPQVGAILLFALLALVAATQFTRRRAMA